MSRTITVAICCGLAAVGCAGERGTSRPPSSVRDSAGIVIVESVAPALPDDAWRVSDVPDVTIGGLASGSDQELYQVVGATRFDDGRIAIANAGSSEIKLFESDGTFVRNVGSPGGGPGEFERLSAIKRFGPDSLVALDGQQRRVSIYDRDGNLGRMSTLAFVDGGGMPFLGATFDVFSDRTFFLSTLNIFGTGPSTGLVRNDEPAFRLSDSGAVLDSLGAFPGREMFVMAVGGNVTATLRIFGRSTSYAVNGAHLFVGTNDRNEIARFSHRGSLEMLIRTTQEPPPVRGGDRDAFMRSRLETIEPNRRAQYEERYAGNEPPATHPAYSEILADDEGYLWVGNYLRPTETDRRYSVFDPEGRWATVVDVPDDITVLEIGSDYLLARWTDGLDVEYVRAYTLSRPRARP